MIGIRAVAPLQEVFAWLPTRLQTSSVTWFAADSLYFWARCRTWFRRSENGRERCGENCDRGSTL